MFGKARMREGVRLPSERAGVFMQPAGPVTTYHLSPEEIAARYGPPAAHATGYVPRERRPPADEVQEEEIDVAPSTFEGIVLAEPPTMPAGPFYALGGPQVRLQDLGAHIEAVLVLLGENAVLKIAPTGLVIVRGPE